MAFGYLSNRMGSLIFLYLFMVFCSMSVLFMFAYGKRLPLLVIFMYDSNDSSDSSSVNILVLIISVVGIVIFFRAIVFILYVYFQDTSSVFLLWKAIVFSMLIVFCDVFGVLYRPNSRNKWFKSEFDMLTFTVVKNLIIFYAITVFHGYIAELKEKQSTAGTVPVHYNVQDKEVHISPPSCYYLPQYSTQPSSYPVQTSGCVVESNKY